MKNKMLAFSVMSLLVSLVCVAVIYAAAPAPGGREQANSLLQAGNFKDAYNLYRKLVLDPKTDPNQVVELFNNATQSLQQLGRVSEIDEFREEAVKVHAKNWRLVAAVGYSYFRIEQHGFIVAGKFHRGHHRGGGRAVTSAARDRVRGLQLIVEAMNLAKDDPARAEVADLYKAFAQFLLSDRGYEQAWRLQYLTDLTQLPDYEDGWNYDSGAGGAPVDESGTPIYYKAPRRFENAKNDGERWRWALNQAMEVAPNRVNEVRMELARFSQSQFGVATMAYYGRFFGRQNEADDGDKDESGTYALHTLGEDETIARLATGIKRFKLPDEFNYIRIYQQVAAEPKKDRSNESLDAQMALAGEFENRRQYPKAADYYRRIIRERSVRGSEKEQLDQIIGNWGRFENIMTQPAGKGATVEFRFRNASKVDFEASEIKVETLLADVKAYLKSNPARLEWQTLNISDIGHRLLEKGGAKYIGAKVANWSLDLKPRKDHFDDRVTVTTPLQKAGAYLVTAKLAGGNTSKIVMWLADTAIVKKPTNGGTFYYVADAINGEPVAKANLEFFGYRQRHTGGNKFTTDTQNFAEFTDEQGQLIRQAKGEENQYQWIITATTKPGRFAYLGFTGVWNGNYYDAEYQQRKVFTITDRPVYRPGQKVKYKFWIRHAKYDQEDVSDFAKQPFTVEIHNPKGEKISSKAFTSDEFGGLDGEFELPGDATLGVYQIMIPHQGGSQFRVEEYKKPEYEVSVDAPSDPVMLGEKITATIKAKYYFGAPVTEAKVKYKVTRNSYSNTWYPPAPWDWLYGRGYWWFAYDYNWYPGWSQWGCVRPIAWWWGPRHNPPEIIAETEVAIGADGTVKVEIDTAVAKAVHGDQDHHYTVTAEVVDQSRRTIVGTGSVLVARKPFKVFSWVDRGYYRIGDVVKASFSAQTLDQKPVKGSGKLNLLKISYKDGKPVETSVREWDLNPDAQGYATLQIKASEAGQYRLSYKVTDEQKHTIEGGYVFTIIGEGFDGAEFRFNDLELVADKADYAPGQTVNLQVNTNRAGGTVLLFVRPANGIYLKPKIVRLKGKSFVDEIAVIKKDMPNFFIEAITIANGRLFTETKEIVVPPEKRVLNVEVMPSAETYKPGQKAEVKLKLTDFDGKPYLGSTVLAIYDKAVEYVSGGSNVQEIKAFFWKWRRSHHANTETTLGRMFGNMFLPNVPGMQNLGIFGDNIEETDGEAEALAEGGGGGGGGRGRANFGIMRKGGVGGMALEARTMMAAPSPTSAPGAAMAGGAGFADAAPAAMDRMDDGGSGEVAMAEATVRTKFADTALWAGALTTDKDGLASVSLDMPENLTTWKVKVWGMGHGTKVGQGEAEVITRKDLIVRLQAPRFFVEKDEVVISANVHNYLKEKKSARVILEFEGKTLQNLAAATQTVEVEANGEKRVDWRVKVENEGEAIVRVKALTDQESDALEMRFPVYVHGMLKTDSYSGALRPEDTVGKITMKIPKERRIEQSRLEVRYSPSLAGAMVDALPYLADYPYGCTEQTLNRFVPSVITQKVLIEMGLDLKAIGEKRTNLNAQEIGDDKERAKGWKRFDRNPVFDNDELTKMVKAGVQRLTEMQLSDGGWGWFSGYGEHSSAHTTAVVVHGLQVAQANDVALVPGMLDRGLAWLKTYQDRQVELLNNALVKPEPKKPYKTKADNLDAFVYMVLVDGGIKNDSMRDFLYRDRVSLAVYAKALLGLALHKQGEKEKLTMIMENISQFVVEDAENQTAYLKLPEDNYWWYWYGSEIEAQAYYLKLLAKTDAKGALAPKLVKYLLNNRKHGTYWNSTRDTSLAIEALADYLKASGENKPDLTVEVWLGGKKRKEVKITAADLFTFDNKFVIEGDGVEDGEQTLELRKTGKSPLYYNAYLTNFTLEDRITKAGLEVKVQRQLYKLTAVDKKIKASGSRGQAVDQKVEKYERSAVADLGTLKSGDLVEIELEIDSKNDYEYLIFEDMKAAGFEPVEVRSGYGGNDMGAYMELRDNRVSFFVRSLARGKHSVSYRLRAEIPGQFSGLPATAMGMYAPELRGNSDEFKVKIED